MDAENEEHRRETASEQEPEASGNQEAAKYRRRLREVEAERDQLAEQVRSLRTVEVERQVSDALEDPSDLWRHGTELGQLLDEQGGLDTEKVAEAASAATTAHPSWAKRLTGFDEDQGRASEAPAGASWSGLLRSAGREK